MSKTIAAWESGIGDWEKRHNEIEEQREEIRNRVRKTRSGNGVIREAKPKPTISDTGHKQVGVYARVSTKSTNQVSSIENQTKYYTKKVGDTPNWILHEIYSDEGKSGTSTQHRTEFKRMIEDAAQKKIDLMESLSHLFRRGHFLQRFMRVYIGKKNLALNSVVLQKKKECQKYLCFHWMNRRLLLVKSIKIIPM